MSSARQPAKKRGAPHKSRSGCRNCKLRRLKCDETKPHCVRCWIYGVRCNFGFNVPDLQPLNEEQTEQELARIRPRLAPPRVVVNKIICSDDGSTGFILDAQDRALFDRFRSRTARSLGGAATVNMYENHMFAACFTCPFLMHGTLAVTAAHDRYLSGIPAQHRTLRETHHWAQCTTLFNKWLNRPIKEEHKDVLWATAGSLAILTFSSVTASSPEQAWPLGAPDSTDLEWLRLGHGKMALWDVVNPLRPESIFRTVYTTKSVHSMHQDLPKQGTDGIPIELARMCGLEESSTRENNPYFMVAHRLSRLLEVPTGEVTHESVSIVAGHMHGEFATCLREKDPVALLLLCLWYTRARESIWWMEVRARFEIPAICTYLQRYYGDNSAVQALIPWAK